MAGFLPRFYKTLVRIYQDLVVSRSKDQTFWILTAFVPTFIVARLFARFFPGTFLQINGSHVHHFIWGFLILAVSGYLAIIRPTRAPIWLASMFGIGLALAIDEAGMWLHLTNQYYNETSENTIIVTIALLINLVYFRYFWLAIIKAMLRTIRKI